MDLPEQPNLYIYSRFKDRINSNGKYVPFYFLGSSSKGNSVYLKDLYTVIDLGFPYQHYKDLDINFFLYVDYLFLTHEHTDHLNPSTLCKVLKMYPNVKVVMSPNIYHAITEPNDNRLTIKQKTMLEEEYHSRLIITDKAQTFTLRSGKTMNFIPHITEHGPIKNMAIELTCTDLNIQFMYASDLDTLGPGTHSNASGLPQDPTHKYTLLLLEANYDKDKLNDYIDNYDHQYNMAKLANNEDEAKYYYNKKYRAEENLRHISEQETWDYVQTHLTNTGWFVPLHASTMYGTLVQNLDEPEDDNDIDEDDD